MSYKNDEIIRIINKRNTMVMQECELSMRDTKQLLRRVTDSLVYDLFFVELPIVWDRVQVLGH